MGVVTATPSGQVVESTDLGQLRTVAMVEAAATVEEEDLEIQPVRSASKVSEQGDGGACCVC